MKPIRVLALLEATSITGPAKNLIEFGSIGRELKPPVHLSIATIRRPFHPPRDPFLDRLDELEIPCSILRESSAWDLSTLSSLRSLVSQQQPDLFQTHNVKSNFLSRLAGMHRLLPWIAWHHGYTQPTFKQRAYNQLDRISLRAADRIVTVTSAFLPELYQAGVARARIEVIPNAIRPFLPTDPVAHPGLLGSRLLVAIGRLSKEKDHAALIEAAAGLPNVHVLIVGEGHEREALIQLALSRNVPLTLAGQVQDVRPYLAAAHLFVLPSLSEGSPNVLIEAMAAGLPIVSTSVGGVPDTVTDNEHALLVPAGKPLALREAIERLLNQPDLAVRLAQAARQRALGAFQPEARAQSIQRLYLDVLQSRRNLSSQKK